ncbi:MAG: hypothetical protein QM652_00725 [Legionella sp.]|uniref:hypothetical protein n=1 Tax=Legionella sp. TaxID=459 RepID=UPI0039E725BD
MSTFFRMLNPTEKHTGFIYEVLDGPEEMVDLTVCENISRRYRGNKAHFSLGRIFDLLMGDHYYILHPCDSPPTAKGILDFLIFPLISRALILSPESAVAGIFGLIIAIPLEIARFSLGVGLTILLAPIAALIDLIQVCLPKKNIEDTHPIPSNAL